MSQGTIEQVLRGDATWCVLCADNLEVMRGMPDSSVVAYGDPPYNVKKPILNDDMPWDEYIAWMSVRIAELTRISTKLFLSFRAGQREIDFTREITPKPNYRINWHKPMMLSSRSFNGSPFLAHQEPIFYWGSLNPKVIGKLGYDSFAVNAMWPSERRAEGIECPVPKPPALMVEALTRWTQPDEIVLDPFCGSGTTLIAARRLGRRCIGIDLSSGAVAESSARLAAEERYSHMGTEKRGQGGLFSNG